MKKRYVMLASLCIMSMLAVGCGNKSNDAEATPTPEPTIEVSDQSNVVEMEQSTGIDKSKITKIMGTKTASSSELVVTNKTGLEISGFYVRSSGDEDWSSDYIQSKFTLKDGEQALYYYDSMEKDDSGNTITKFDLRVSYTDEDESDCMFRNLTLTDIDELKLNMEDGVPFVTYTSLSTKREVSTLEDAKARMGRTDDSEDTDEEDSENSDTETTTTPTPEETEPADTDDPYNSGEDPSDPAAPGADEDPGSSDQRSAAEGTIGQSVDALNDACGGANSSEYVEDEDTGAQIGYYYYEGYTVSTTLQDGEEVVTGVW